MQRLRPRWKLVLALVIFASLGISGQAWAQAGEGWSWIITPQLWLPHIDKNGFTPAPSGNAGLVVVAPDGSINPNPFGGRNSEPVDPVDPQWGLQLAAQKGRWTIAGSFQHVDFETRSEVVSTHPTPVLGFFEVIAPGARLGNERISTERFDIDFAVTYLFPDVMPGLLDISVGGGVKVIHARATRRFESLSEEFLAQNFLFSGLYIACRRDDLTPGAPDPGCRNKQQVKTTDWIYGATIPMNATFRLTGDARWLLPVSVTPFLGAETRDDKNVVYRFTGTTVSDCCRAERIDGTTFAYGVTADATLRYIVNESLSFYGGMRVQYIEGHETFLAYGPLVGMSVRFGGR